MTQDWAAVARAVNQRMTELGVSPARLIIRSGLSKQVVFELQHNSVQRRRSARTLEALSVGLEWHPHHLTAVLEHRKPPPVGEPIVTYITPEYDVPARLEAVEHRLEAVEQRLSEMIDRWDRIEAWLDRIEMMIGDKV
jgi:hypothetical protein